MMPRESVYQSRLLVAYAVPTPSLALRVQRGSMPGPPNARRARAPLPSIWYCPPLWIQTDQVTTAEDESDRQAEAGVEGWRHADGTAGSGIQPGANGERHHRCGLRIDPLNHCRSPSARLAGAESRETSGRIP